MTSSSHLVLLDGARPGARPDRFRSASRPSALRALLARSVTMTALEIERRIRTRRRKPSTEARSLRSLAVPRQRRVSRAVHETQAADAGLQRTILRFP